MCFVIPKIVPAPPPPFALPSAQEASAPSLDWWHPKLRPHCAPEEAPVTGEGLDVVDAEGTRRCCVGPASSATAAPAPAPAPVTKAPWHSACLVYVNAKEASREEQSQSQSQSPPPPATAVSSYGYDDTVSGAQENESTLAPSTTTAVCHLAGGLVAVTFGFAAVGLLLVVRRGVRCGRRSESERERRRAGKSGGLLSPGRASSESSSSSCPCGSISH